VLLKTGEAFPKGRHREIVYQLEYPPVTGPHDQRRPEFGDLQKTCKLAEIWEDGRND
jgi:hypothetical protein